MKGMTAKQWETLQAGSMERRIQEAQAMASRTYGRPVTLIATKQVEWFGVDEETQTLLRFTPGTNGEVTVAEVPVTEAEFAHEKVVAEALSDAVDALFADDEVARKRLRGLALAVEPEGVYWLSEAMTHFRTVLDEAQDWRSIYEDHRKEVRKSLHGSLGTIEGQVPTFRYSRVTPAERSQYRAELGESYSLLVTLADGIVDESRAMGFHESEAAGIPLAETRDSLASSAERLSRMLKMVLALGQTGDLGPLAEAHDAAAEFLKPMLVTTQFLKERSK